MEDPIRLSEDEMFARSATVPETEQQQAQAQAQEDEPRPPAWVPFKPADVAHVAWDDVVDPSRPEPRAAFVESLHKVGFAFVSLPDSMMGTTQCRIYLFCSNNSDNFFNSEHCPNNI
jgi:hypothetical protein